MANLFVEVLRSYMRAGKFVIHDFVVMPNHVHILMTIPGDTSLEKAVQLLKGNFSYRAARELGFKGEIWQRGFSDVRITSDQSFAEHCRYIAENPVKEGLAKTAQEFPFGSVFLKLLKQTGPKEAAETLHQSDSACQGTTSVVPNRR
jgi:putative transposase